MTVNAPFEARGSAHNGGSPGYSTNIPPTEAFYSEDAYGAVSEVSAGEGGPGFDWSGSVPPKGYPNNPPPIIIPPRP